MDFKIKPINTTGTIAFVDNSKNVHIRRLAVPDTKIMKDKSVIPTGILKVIKLEQNRLKFILYIGIFLFVIQFATVLFLYFEIFSSKSNHWSAYIIPIVGILYYSYKIPSVLIEFHGFKKSTTQYELAIKSGSSYTPPYIAQVYLKLNKKQISSMWLTITICFYGAIFTLIFWWLKDVNTFFGLLDFKSWINASFQEPFTPQVATIIFSITIAIIIFFYFFFTILRKKRLVNIESCFGNEVIPRTEIEKIKTNLNKLYGKIFFISILIVLLFPIIVRLIYKKLKK